MIRLLAVLALWPALAWGGACEGVRYVMPTDRYAHCVLGDCLEWAGLEVDRPGAPPLLLVLPQDRVFEDLAPRCAPMGPGGARWILVVESAERKGAQLAAYGVVEGVLSKRAQTPHIGRQNRWLAPAGIADFNGDGRLDVAFVDRPHLAKTLRVVTAQGARFVELAAADGHSNHRIGEAFISGGVRTCGSVPEIVTANAAWTEVLTSRLEEGALVTTPLGAFTGRESFARALACD